MRKKTGSSTPPESNLMPNREAWLATVARHIEPLLQQHRIDAPAKYRISIGFTRSGRKGARAEAWDARKSEGGAVEMFIRPDTADELDLAAIVTALLVLSSITETGQAKKQYKNLAAEIGLRGPLNDPHPAPHLRALLQKIVQDVGPFPHEKLDIGTTQIGAAPKQSTRMLAALCPAPDCGGRIRLSHAASVDPGLPICAKHGLAFKLAKDAAAAEAPTPSLDSAMAAAPDSTMPPSPKPEPEATPEPEPTVEPVVAMSEMRVAPQAWTVSFPASPPLPVRNQMKSFGTWDAKRSLWGGTGDVENVRVFAQANGGSFHPVENVGDPAS